MYRNVIGLWAMVLSGFSLVVAGDLAGNPYADINNDLFITPKSSSMAGADASISRSALPLGNPANLAADSVNRVDLAYAGFYRNTFSTSALSYIGNIDPHSSFGVSVSYLLVPDIKILRDTVDVRNETGSASETYFRAGYGRTVWTYRNKLSVAAGIALNAQRRNLIDINGYGIGLDAALSAHVQELGFSACALLENVTTSYTRWSGGYDEFAYPHARIGLGWRRDFEYIYGALSVSYLSPDLFSNEGVNSFDADTMRGDPSLKEQDIALRSPERYRISTHPSRVIYGKYGAEYVVMNRLAFRAGVNLATLNFSFGAGLCLIENRAGIDFAYLSHELAPTYKISVNYTWL